MIEITTGLHEKFLIKTFTLGSYIIFLCLINLLPILYVTFQVIK